MTSMLPPTRDLPPGRQARIRAEVERAATRHERRRLAVPILAAAAAVAVVTAGVVVLRPTPTVPQPAVHVTTSPATPTVDFGISREEVAAIEAGCAKSAGTGQPKLHQLMNDQTRWAVLYSDKEGLVCSVGVGGQAYNSAFTQTTVQWLPGHFSIDYQGARSGGAMDGRPESANVPGDRTSVGRVDHLVARVTFTADGQTVEAKVANGTYAARIYYPPSWGIPQEPAPSVVRAYDAKGNLLGTSTDLETTCYFEPYNMKVVYGTRKAEADDCEPVSPWR
jgi:hypothetical protein